MRAFWKMLVIETKLSIRDMNMVIFAVIMPIIVLIILGIIYKNNPAYEGANYTFIEQSFGALCSIAICAGGLMGLPIVISEYRERKILKRFQVTPISPLMILIVHLCIYALYAAVSVASLWLLAAVFWGFQMKGSIVIFIAGWVLVLISTLSIGMLVGGVAKNTKSASIIASLLYFPMLIFSGATLPYEVMPSTMQKIVTVFPFTQGVKILKATTLGLPLQNMTVYVIITMVVAILCVATAVKFFEWE